MEEKRQPGGKHVIKKRKKTKFGKKKTSGVAQVRKGGMMTNLKNTSASPYRWGGRTFRN